MPEFAKHIEVIRHGRKTTLRIDGDEFAYFVGEIISYRSQHGAMPGITVELLADRVDIEDRPWPSIDGTAGQRVVTDPKEIASRPARTYSARDPAGTSLGEGGMKVGTAYIEVKPVYAPSLISALADELEAEAHALRESAKSHPETSDFGIAFTREAMGIETAVHRLRQVAIEPNSAE